MALNAGLLTLVCDYRVVEFRTKGDMAKALNTLNETMLDGRKIFLKEVCDRDWIWGFYKTL